MTIFAIYLIMHIALKSGAETEVSFLLFVFIYLRYYEGVIISEGIMTLFLGKEILCKTKNLSE